GQRQQPGPAEQQRGTGAGEEEPDEPSARQERQVTPGREVVGEPEAARRPGDEPSEPKVTARSDVEDREPGCGDRARNPCDLGGHGATTTSARALWPRAETMRW